VDGSVILPEHVVFPPDLESDRSSREDQNNGPVFSNNTDIGQNRVDLSLASAVRRHVQFVIDLQLAWSFPEA
jgi:hypothetical protein